MDKDQLVRQIMAKGKDYSQQTYLAGFFLAFIILIVLIIRPSINDYVIRQKQLEETKLMVEENQKVIVNLTKLQSVLEAHRSDFDLLNRAVPNGTGLYQLAKDVERSILPYTPTKSYTFAGYTYPGVKAVSNSRSNEPKSYAISSSVQGTYPALLNLLQDISDQSRIKTIKSIMLSRSTESSSSANLNMTLDIEAYHL